MIMTRGVVMLFGLALLALGACSSHQHFRPREASMVQSSAGYPAAQYQLGEADQSGDERGK